MTFSITPLVASYGPRREKSRFTFLHNFGEKIDLPYVSWLVQSTEHGLNVLVDVGCSATEYRQHIKASEERKFRHAGEEFDESSISTLSMSFSPIEASARMTSTS